MMAISSYVKTLIAFALLAQLASCSSTPEGTYRGGVLVQPGPLAIQDYYAFRFVDKWRISHAWLSGPVGIDYCRYTRRDGDLGEDRFIEIDGVLKAESISGAPKDKGKNIKFIWNPYQKIYGSNSSAGKFEGYGAFCSTAFEDIWTGVSVLLVMPDQAKGTDEWIAGAKPAIVNGLNWLRKDIVIADYSQDKKKVGAPVEIWVLKIPDTPYWLMMRIASSTGGTGTAPGSNRNPEKFARVLDLFHQMVGSVRLEPITPMNTGTLSTKPAP